MIFKINAMNPADYDWSFLWKHCGVFSTVFTHSRKCDFSRRRFIRAVNFHASTSSHLNW